MTRLVGIVGAGAVVETLHLPVLGAMPDVRVAWLCDRDGARARTLASRFGIAGAFDDLARCPDVEAVLVATPVGTRRPLLEAAFARGWHVLAEKPFAVTRDDHQAMLAAAAAAGRQVGVGLMRRFYRGTLIARRVLAARPFGDIVEVLAGEGGRMRATGRGADWYQADPKLAGGGILAETGSHLIDQVCFALDAVGGRVVGLTERRAAELEVDVRFTVSLRLAGQGPCSARFLLSKVDDVPDGIWVRAERATLAFGTLPSSPVRLLDPEGRELAVLGGDEGATQTYQAFHLEWRDFLDACASGKPGLSDARLARGPTALVEQCYEGSRKAMEATEALLAGRADDGAGAASTGEKDGSA